MHMNQFLAALSKLVGKRTPGASSCSAEGCEFEAPKGQKYCHACTTNKLLEELSNKFDNLAKAFLEGNVTIQESRISNPSIHKKDIVREEKKFIPSINLSSESSNLNAESKKSGRDLSEIAEKLPK